MGGWKTILLLKIFLFFYVHIRVCFAEQMSFLLLIFIISFFAKRILLSGLSFFL